jgi:hypothetical protein
LQEILKMGETSLNKYKISEYLTLFLWVAGWEQMKNMKPGKT